VSDSEDFLFEIGTEELPPKALRKLGEALESGVRDGLKKAALDYNEMRWYAAPRRLAVTVSGLVSAQADTIEERRGPAVTAAFDDDGLPTRALQGFAKSCGVEVDLLETLETKKGAWLVYRRAKRGQASRELLPAIVETALKQLPIPKRMRWGASKAEFVRPVHWLVMLLGGEVIKAEMFGLETGQTTRGHRFHHPETIYLAEPATYAPLLESEGRVMADFEARREAVRGQVMEVANEIGGTAVIDSALLDEVTGMVEWPVALAGDFDTRFLEVPPEALISAMKGHQKYFHVVNEAGELMPHFITVSNIESTNMEVVRSGNERVIRPRLSDAVFFWQQDRKQPLSALAARLERVVFQKKLGTLQEKSIRIASLAAEIAAQLGGDRAQAQQAGELSKCDLMTEMVGEFPELQGIMGRYYATLDGAPREVAAALDEQYLPRFAGDALPQHVIAESLAIADKLDTLIGIFAIGQSPSGDKDPFALRRAALGVLRIIIEKALPLDLEQLLKSVAGYYDAQGKVSVSDETIEHAFSFMMGRLQGYYVDQGIRRDLFDAVLSRRPTEPRDFDLRLRAVEAFRKLPQAESLAAANKRIANILKKVEGDIPAKIDPSLLTEASEQALFAALSKLTDVVTPMFAAGDYTRALTELAALQAAVDLFFDEVMVMVDDDALRNNRIALLNALLDLFMQAADLSRLQAA